MKYINELREGEMISETYLCKGKQVQKTKAGKSYYSLIIQDKTGSIDGKVWELTNGIDDFDAMDYIHIDGQVTCFQGSFQMNIKRIRISQEGEYIPADYVPVSEKDINEMYKDLMRFITKIEEEHLKKLAEHFFIEDKEFIDAFKKHSAAKTIHHEFMGGLLEHTLGVVKFCDYMASHYPIINRDLLISGALYHDIGKLTELSDFPLNDYTDDGQLLGHIFIGAKKIGDAIGEIDGFPKKLASELLHCILSHHGELEYGSPKKPALIEALALSFADSADSKLQTMTELLKSNAENSGWLGYNRLFESNVRRSSK